MRCRLSMVGWSGFGVLFLLALSIPAAAGEFAQRVAQALGDRTFVSFPRIMPDRVFAGHYPPGREWLVTVAYFEAPEPGAEGGRLIIWDWNQKELLRGTWTAEDFRLCVEPNAFYTLAYLSWRLDERMCVERNADVLINTFYEGDVFGLAKRQAPPFQLSTANASHLFKILRGAVPTEALR